VDLAAVFLLSLLGGYYFAITWRLTAFSTKKADGHHLYFRAALYGVILFALALTLRVYLVGKYPSYAGFDSELSSYVRPVLKEEAGAQAIDEIKRAQWVVTAAYSLVLGPIVAGNSSGSIRVLRYCGKFAVQEDLR
jgi:hypothetical protein